MKPHLRLISGLLVLLPISLATAQVTADTSGKIDDLQHQAEKYLQEQKPQLALPIFRKIVTLDPQNVNALGNLGVLLFFQNIYPEAITEMRAALQLQPTLWRIEALLGIAEKRTGDLTSAETDLETSFPHLDDIKIQKEAGLELIETASATGQLEQAAAIAAKLAKIAPQDPQVLFASYQISLQMADQALVSMTIAAPNSAELHMMMADQFVHQGNSDDAIVQYREAIRLNPRLPGVHFELAAQLKASSDPALRAQAEHEFRTALSLNQADEKAWRGLGELMADKGNFAAAKEGYTKALALFPQDSDAETGLAKVLMAHGDTKSAISLLESAVKDDPTNIVAHYQLSGAYRQAGRNEEATHEMEQFSHYKRLKESLGKVFQQFREQDAPAKKDAQHSSH